jgi:hypothetical protein
MPAKRYKVFSYPYLSSFTKDYVNSAFTISEEISKQDARREFLISIVYKIKNDEINDLILDGTVKAIARITCASTCYSATVELNPEDATGKLIVGVMDIGDDVEITGYVIATDSFEFSNSDLSRVWAGQTCFIEKGNVIGESNTIELKIKHKGDSSSSSIYNFIWDKGLQENSPYNVNLSKDRITIGLPKKRFEQFKKLQLNTAYVPFLLTGILLPVISQIYALMYEPEYSDCENKDTYEYNDFNKKHRGKTWYNTLFKKHVDLVGKSPYEDSNAVVAAQKVLESPFGTMFDNLSQLRKVVKTDE